MADDTRGTDAAPSPDQQTGYEESAPNDEEPLLTADEQTDLIQAEPKPRPVTYSGQDFDVDGLVRRLNNDDILIPTFGHADPRITSAGFQRGFVWSRPQMDRFIESLLLGYPIPGIFLVRQRDKRYLVLDGQQRLSTLQLFYSGVHAGKEFALQNVGDDFKRLTYKTLTGSQRRILDNAFLQATIVDTDGSPSSLDAVYQIFERLNSGGTQLTPHEIRVALYAGPFIDYLEGLNQSPTWRDLYGRTSPRIRDQELVLRIIALYRASDDYSRPLKKFLNEFTANNRKSDQFDSERVGTLFGLACGLLLASAGKAAIRPRSQQVNAALTEALIVGLMRRLQRPIEEGAPKPAAIERAVLEIGHNPDMQVAISRSTADEESVKTRLRIATEHFSKV